MADEVNVSIGQESGATPEEVEQHNAEMVAKVDGVPLEKKEGESTSEPSDTEAKEEEAEGLGVPNGKEEEEQQGVPKTETQEDKEQSQETEEEADARNDGEDDKSSGEKGELFSETEWKDYLSEFQEHGELSENSLQQIVAKGLPETLVRDYLEGVKAQSTLREQQVQQTTNEIFEMTGGKESYQAMQEWAKDTLTPEEKKTFNEAVYSGNTALAKLAVQGLHARYAQEGSINEISLVTNATTNGNTNSAQGAYGTWAEVRRDMARPEYKKDPAFQAQVRAKLARSSRL